jgi:hypothetical protein
VCIGLNLDQLGHGLTHVSPVSVEDRAFDRLFADAEKFRIGNIVGEVLYLSTIPSLGPAAPSEMVVYLIGQNIITSVPGGFKSLQEDSMRRLLGYSPDHKVYGVPFKVSRLSQAFITVEQLHQQLFN